MKEKVNDFVTVHEVMQYLEQIQILTLVPDK